MDNLRELLSTSASQFPGNPAIIFGQQAISFQALYRITNRIANGISGIGTDKGGRAAILLAGSPHFVSAYFGIVLYRLLTGRVLVEEGRQASIK